MLVLEVKNKNGETRASACGEKEVNLYIRETYRPGDVIELSETDGGDRPMWLHLALDDVIGESLVYWRGEPLQYAVPFGTDRLNLNPKAFSGDSHLLSARIAGEYETQAYRCLSENRWDQGDESSIYPHAFSNIETRGEVVFAARNVIDGMFISDYHGEWPYTSWGPDLMVKDYYLQLDFGRVIKTDRVVLRLRTDFPHDAWWKSARLTFSDGSEEIIAIEKTDHEQVYTFEKKATTSVRLDQLICDEASDSPFPALMQMQVWGTEQ